MPVIVLEARDFTSPLFTVRTLEVVFCCATFSLVASQDSPERSPDLNTFWILGMFTWCFFFVVTLFIHILNVIQFHSLIPISWKNLTMTVAVLGALMTFSSSVVFAWRVMDHNKVSPRSVAAAVMSCLSVLAYASESLMLRTQAHDQRGYMGSTAGLLKILQLWGGLQMIPLVVLVSRQHSVIEDWHLWVLSISCGVCILMSLITLVVILGDLAGRCILPFDRFLAFFSLVGVLLYMMATVICLTKLLQLSIQDNSVLVIMETVVSSITLLAYTVDLAFSIKLLCDRNYM
ncbi:myeloid-associated differentiation marker homolog [Nothobranchius furzeri]|uniref:Myeloid-associated differentiation marker homolog n=1 Tax=Nothobranchius furzeri TaxID=105023 RepID=A0A8C6PQA3_NOTFU|nr:myeloid-associated differentiation marker homolog [Nothobranchius furzeri]KAF7223703.1 myeloid-associated differentiation marker-like protein [Nothobranchius furzeri]